MRLFTELGARNRELIESLERETATGSILRAIAMSPTDPAPVFEAILESALRLCHASVGGVNLSDGRVVSVAALRGRPAWVEAVKAAFPRSLDDPGLTTRAIREGVTVHVPDVRAEPSSLRLVDDAGESRAELYAPMLREGRCIGVVAVQREEPGLFSEAEVALLHTLADQAAIAVENVRLFTELEARNRELTESLEQQTATSEILRVISRSQTDLQPVFDTIADNLQRLFVGWDAWVTRYEDGLLYNVAVRAGLPEVASLRPIARPFPATPELTVGRCVLAASVIHVADVLTDSVVSARSREIAMAYGWRSALAAPMLRTGQVIGAVMVTRREAGAFTEREIELIQTFADQAVIAVENVRLFTELQEKNRVVIEAHAEVTEALEQQTATSEILRVISSSPTDLQPVFDAVADNAARLCEAPDVIILRVDGDALQRVASVGPFAETLRPDQQFPMVRGSVAGRAIVDQRTLHIRDLASESDDEFPVGKDLQRRYGHRTMLAVPLLREGMPLGVIAVVRTEVRPFSDGQVSLLETFAAQAAIAIENVRLFKELEARTQDLTRSVGELRALGDVGRALSSTLDLDTVLQTIVTRASQLAGTDACSVFEYDEVAEVFRLRASSYRDPGEAQTLDAIGRATPIPKGQGVVSRAAASRQPVQVSDIAVEGSYESPIRGPLMRAGYRALLTVPLFLEERVIGALGVSRKTPGEFAPEIVRLLTTFATQSALAIQNARLFREIADKSRQLEAASHHKSEFLANMSHELRTPLNAILGFSEVLAERMFGEVNAKQAEYLQDILSSGRHLLSLINDILDLSKVEAGRLELELGRFHLPTALDNALTLVRERATRHGITLTQTVDPGVADIVADERKVKQILLNLLSNAVKFTPEGGRVGLTATAAEKAITIAVSDTGIGIAPEDQAAIFEEFRQVGARTLGSRRARGSG